MTESDTPVPYGDHLRDPLDARLAAARDEVGACLPGGAVLGCSGGSDSVALAALAADARAAAPAGGRCILCHLDHGLRPDSAGETDFVRDLAGRLDLDFEGSRVPLPDLQSMKRGNLEDIARQQRYLFLFHTAKTMGYATVLTGHTADDAAETVWLWFLRGAGLRGLRAIPLRRPLGPGGRVTLLRPLLGLRRGELRDLLRERGLDWLEDPSNRDLSLRRNWLRHKLFSMIREDLDLDPVPAALRLARHSERIAGYLTGELERRGLRPASPREDGAVLDRRVLADLPDALAAWYLMEGPGAAGGLDERSLGRLLDLVRGPATGEVPLPGGRRATVDAGRVSFHEAEAAPPPPPGLARLAPDQDGRELPAAGAVDLAGGWRLRVATRPGPLPPPGDPRGARFDAGALALPLRLTSPREGMRVRLLGGPGTRRLSRLLIDRKVPAAWRGRAAVVVDATGRVVWVPGLARGDAAPVGPATRRVLCLDLEPLEAAAPPGGAAVR